MFKKLILGLAVSLSLFVASPGMVLAAADPTGAAKNHVCEGISGQVGGDCTRSQSARLSGVMKNVLNVLSIIAGVAAVIMIIISGMKYITSGGDSSSVASAKNTLIYAVVGLIVVALSQFIVFFVLDTL